MTGAHYEVGDECFIRYPTEKGAFVRAQIYKKGESEKEFRVQVIETATDGGDNGEIQGKMAGDQLQVKTNEMYQIVSLSHKDAVAGMMCLYFNKPHGYFVSATVIKKHFDDDPPYFTIELETTKDQRQTIMDRLYVHPLPDGSKTHLNTHKSKKSHTRASKADQLSGNTTETKGHAHNNKSNAGSGARSNTANNSKDNAKSSEKVEAHEKKLAHKHTRSSSPKLTNESLRRDRKRENPGNRKPPARRWDLGEGYVQSVASDFLRSTANRRRHSRSRSPLQERERKRARRQSRSRSRSRDRDVDRDLDRDRDRDNSDGERRRYRERSRDIRDRQRRSEIDRSKDVPQRHSRREGRDKVSYRNANKDLFGEPSSNAQPQRTSRRPRQRSIDVELQQMEDELNKVLLKIKYLEFEARQWGDLQHLHRPMREEEVTLTMLSKHLEDTMGSHEAYPRLRAQCKEFSTRLGAVRKTLGIQYD